MLHVAFSTAACSFWHVVLPMVLTKNMSSVGRDLNITKLSGPCRVLPRRSQCGAEDLGKKLCSGSCAIC